MRQQRFIEIAPLQSVRTCLIAAHETGHVLHPPLVDERSVKTEIGTTVCVAAELEAWRWVLANTPTWSPAMHADLTRFVNTYRRHATPAEAATIDRLCSSLELKRTQLRITMDGGCDAA